MALFHADSMWAESAQRREQFLAEAEHQRLIDLAKHCRLPVERAATAPSLLQSRVRFVSRRSPRVPRAGVRTTSPSLTDDAEADTSCASDHRREMSSRTRRLRAFVG
jgi:hypothetical protein